MADRQSPRLALTRHFKAPIDKVFRAWTEGEALKRWFHPRDDMATVVAEVDLRVGGRYRIVMQEPSGEQHRVGGVYREIVPNAALVFTWAWESTPERESLVSLRFDAAEGGTRLTLVHEKFADEAARDRHAEGWAGCLAMLDRSLA
jgi:uncharacterized protein YndB with AHSA1/START domain